MISQIYRALASIGLIVFFSLVLVFGVALENSSANPAIASMERIEDKAQEAIRNLTGDVKAQSQMPERLKASAKDLEDKAQEAIRNLTGDRQDQAVGKAKQAESSTRNWFENVKDTVKGLFE